MKIAVYFFEIKNLMIDSAILFFDVFGKNFKKLPPTVWLRAKISELVEKRTTEKVNIFYFSFLKKNPIFKPFYLLKSPLEKITYNFC
jgi:hypothetical protein